MKRAIALAGGGPAAGLSIGTLKRLHEEADIQFDVWSTASVGAWIAVLYNQAPKGKELETTIDFFKEVFREDEVYNHFPIASVFTPDWLGMTGSALNFMMDPRNYEGLVLPDQIRHSAEYVRQYLHDPKRWNLGEFNYMMLNHVLAVNPVSRFMTSLMYKSESTGIARVHYRESPLLNRIDFAQLYDPDQPAIYHNAYNLTDQRIERFSNVPTKNHRVLNSESLSACSALPFIEETIEINGKTYCEGACVEAVNLMHLVDTHPDLEEVWISRILDKKQISKPTNLYESLNNLIMLFAATISETDVKLFRYELMERKSNIRVIEVPVEVDIEYDWSHSNLDRCMEFGYAAADQAVSDYRKKCISDRITLVA